MLIRTNRLVVVLIALGINAYAGESEAVRVITPTLLDVKPVRVTPTKSAEAEPVQVITPTLKLGKDATPQPPVAQDDSWWGNIEKTWASDNWYAILPVNTYHARGTYDRDRLRRYNEIPWGAGFGKWYRDKNDNQHELSFIAFADSHGHVEPTFTYSWQQYIHFDSSHNFSVAYGLNFMLTMRNDTYYLPVPLILPHLTIQIGSFAISTLWVPYLGRNNGNVLFTTCRWYF